MALSRHGFISGHAGCHWVCLLFSMTHFGIILGCKQSSVADRIHMAIEPGRGFCSRSIEYMPWGWWLSCRLHWARFSAARRQAARIGLAGVINMSSWLRSTTLRSNTLTHNHTNVVNSAQTKLNSTHLSIFFAFIIQPIKFIIWMNVSIRRVIFK